MAMTLRKRLVLGFFSFLTLAILSINVRFDRTFSHVDASLTESIKAAERQGVEVVARRQEVINSSGKYPEGLFVVVIACPTDFNVEECFVKTTALAQDLKGSAAVYHLSQLPGAFRGQMPIGFTSEQMASQSVVLMEIHVPLSPTLFERQDSGL